MMSGFATIYSEMPRFFDGAIVTLGVSSAGFALGLLIGALILVSGTSRWSVVRAIAGVYTSVVRGTPALVLVLIIYYSLPRLIGIDLPALVAGILALGLNSAAFIAEMLRAGLSRIPKGQYEAAAALDLSRSVTITRIILPQLLRNVLPPAVNEFTMVVKGSAILSVITLVELTRTAQQVMNSTFRPVEAFCTVALIYFVILFTASTFGRWLERRMGAVA